MDESIQEYISALRSLVTDCRYQVLEEELVRDQFISGVRDNGIQEKLLAEEDLGCKKAIHIATSIELAKKDCKLFSVERKSIETYINKISMKEKKYLRKKSLEERSGSKIECFRCKGKHLASDKKCPAKKAKCKKRAKVGHFANCCRSESRSINKESSFGASEKEKIQSLHVLRMHSKKENFFYKYLRVQNTSVPFVLDTGAQCSILNMREVRRLSLEKKMAKSSKKICAFDGQEVLVLGELDLNFAYEYRRHTHRFVVTDK